MSQTKSATKKDTVLIIGFPREVTFDAIKDYERRYKKKLKILILADKADIKALLKIYTYKLSKDATMLTCDFSKPKEIKDTLEPYIPSLISVTVQLEMAITEFRDVIPHIPMLNTPTPESLDWASDKVKMRRKITKHDKNLGPKFMVIHDHKKATIDKIEAKIGYPCVVKPSGLAASMLVEACYHREELEKSLKSAFAKMGKLYEKWIGRGEPTILVEQMLEGAMYSVDAYVDAEGVPHFVPPVHIKTGKAIGVDDYFGYQQITPTKLKQEAIEGLNEAAASAIEAIELKNSIAHVELYRTEDGWKIIELGPRLGGFRHELYEMAFGINHVLNDILIRIPQKPVIPKKPKGFAAVLKIYPRKEGKLATIKGIFKLRNLESFQKVDVHRVKGERVIFARNGGASVLDIYLFNPDRSKLLADIRRIEKNLEVVIADRKRPQIQQD